MLADDALSVLAVPLLLRLLRLLPELLLPYEFEKPSFLQLCDEEDAGAGDGVVVYCVDAGGLGAGVL